MSERKEEIRENKIKMKIKCRNMKENNSYLTCLSAFLASSGIMDLPHRIIEEEESRVVCFSLFFFVLCRRVTKSLKGMERGENERTRREEEK